MQERTEIRGTIRASYLTLLRARQALLEGVAEQDCFLTPRDTDEGRKTIRDMGTVLGDIRKIHAKFENISNVRKELV